ncbi:transmembrane protein 267 [Armigeres subalbatus]|uniref:transmembrane protein 267 n=1 Tax=Armigeres subalbatus TaxID=124917 RepID=UPI002ED5704F
MSPTVLLLLKHGMLLIVCLVGDKLLQTVQKPPLLKAAVDNVTHALIGLIATEIVVHQFRDQLGRSELWLLIGFGFGLASWIDVDHFIEARSFHIHDATNLTHRPFLHNSMIFLVLLVADIVMVNMQDNFRLSIWTAIAFVAFFTHHLRDAIRRGLWFRAPYLNNSTAPVLYWLYLALTQLCPHAVIALLHMQTGGTSGMSSVRYRPLEVI